MEYVTIRQRLINGEWIASHLSVFLGGREVLFHRGFPRTSMSVCNGPIGGAARDGPTLYLALCRIVDPYIFGQKHIPKKKHRRRLLPDEQHLLNSLRG